MGRRPLAATVALACALLALVTAGGATAALPADGAPFPAVAGNPANRLAGQPMDAWSYDRASRCVDRSRRGMGLLRRWLERSSRGSAWGVYRCERWGKGSASLHAESRAIDWHLRAWVPAERRDAERLIRVLLAPDRAGNPTALARRMGVQGIIWDCRQWFGGDALKPYTACRNRDGSAKRGVSRTIAHRDHVHLELSEAGAAAATSWWRSSRATSGSRPSSTSAADRRRAAAQRKAAAQRRRAAAAKRAAAERRRSAREARESRAAAERERRRAEAQRRRQIAASGGVSSVSPNVEPPARGTSGGASAG